MNSEKRIRRRPANVRQINFEVSKQEYSAIQDKADELGMSLAGYCRFTALNSNIKISQNNS